MNNLFATQSTFAPALFASLIHSLWIGGVLYLFLRLFLDLSPAHASTSRYRVSVGALLTQVFLTLGLLAAIYQPDTSVSGSLLRVFAVVELPGASPVAADAAGYTDDIRSTWGVRPSEIALLVYISGVVFFSLRMLVTSSVIRKRIARGRDAATKYTRALEQSRSKLGIRRVVRLVISNQLQSPALYGFFRPVIIVPAGMFTHLSFEQVEVILLHELVHLKKADFLVNLFQQLIEALLFFNPFTWMISGLVREEREKRVDDAVTLHCHSATYAKALFNLSVLQCESPAAMMAANGGGRKLFSSRIQRILKANHMKKSLKTRFYLSAIVAAGAILFISLSGFSSSLLHIDRQQTKAVGASQVPDNSSADKQLSTGPQNIQGPGTFQAVPANGLTGQAVPVNMATAQAVSAVQPVDIAPMTVRPAHELPGSDTLTEKERKELIESLERARQELESIDWDEEMARLEEERARVMEELPKLLKEEQQRVQEELSRIDREKMREQMEQARIQLEAARQQLESTRQQVEMQMQQQMQQLQQQLQSSELHDEKTREAMERSLETLREIDLEKMMQNVQESISNLDMDMDFDYDMDVDIDFDSIRVSVQNHLQEIDIEEIKADVDRSIKEIEMQLQELKSSDAKKK